MPQIQGAHIKLPLLFVIVLLAWIAVVGCGETVDDSNQFEVGENSPSDNVSPPDNDVSPPDSDGSPPDDDEQPCLDIGDVQTVDFGVVPIDATATRHVELRNCSPTADLQLQDVSIGDDADGAFVIDQETLPTMPYVLDADTNVAVGIQYTPSADSEDVGELLVASDDAAEPELVLELLGQGTSQECPVAEAAGRIDDSDSFESFVEAANQDVLQLSSEGSYEPNEEELHYEWSIIERPAGSNSEFVPSANDPEPTLDIDVIGPYRIELMVFNDTGIPTCEAGVVEVDATHDGNIYIELTWEAPEIIAEYGGADQAAQVGTDLDIHYLNAQGLDTWGSNDSIYWQRTHQDWGEHGVARLDIDDLLGVNPENITHDDPGEDGIYRLGVHYFSDNGFGQSNATVRIYFDNELYTMMERPLQQADNFWFVGNIIWLSQPTVSVIDDLEETHPLMSAAGF